MTEERPLLKELAPRLHDFLVDPFGRLWGGWKQVAKPEKGRPPKPKPRVDIAFAYGEER